MVHATQKGWLLRCEQPEIQPNIKTPLFSQQVQEGGTLDTMHPSSFSSVTALLGLLHLSIAAPQVRYYQSGPIILLNSTTPAAPANPNPPSLGIPDHYPIPDTKLSLTTNSKPKLEISEEVILDILEKARASIASQPPTEKLTTAYTYGGPDAAAHFLIEPTVATVLTWDDVDKTLKGLDGYFRLARRWDETDFGLEGQDRGLIATGGLKKGGARGITA